jgi:hypothetical protein
MCHEAAVCQVLFVRATPGLIFSTPLYALLLSSVQAGDARRQQIASGSQSQTTDRRVGGSEWTRGMQDFAQELDGLHRKWKSGEQ